MAIAAKQVATKSLRHHQAGPYPRHQAGPYHRHYSATMATTKSTVTKAIESGCYPSYPADHHHLANWATKVTAE